MLQNVSFVAFFPNTLKNNICLKQFVIGPSENATLYYK